MILLAEMFAVLSQTPKALYPDLISSLQHQATRWFFLRRFCGWHSLPASITTASITGIIKLWCPLSLQLCRQLVLPGAFGQCKSLYFLHKERMVPLITGDMPGVMAATSWIGDTRMKTGCLGWRKERMEEAGFSMAFLRGCMWTIIPLWSSCFVRNKVLVWWNHCKLDFLWVITFLSEICGHGCCWS